MARKQRNAVTADTGSAAVVDRLAERLGTAVLDEPYAIVDVAIADLHPNPQNQPARFKTHDEDLVRSIASMGLLQNPTVCAREAGGYMILDGHRRVAALRALGRAMVPVRVMEDGAARAFEVLITANGQRRDLDPVLESDYVAKLLEQPGWTVDHAAGELGRSREWVARRANLRTLGKRARKEREEGGLLQNLPIAWLEELATLAESAQDELLDDDYTLRECETFDDLRRLVRRQLRALGEVKWDMADADLVKKAGACSTCSKNTAAQPDLYGSDREMQGAHCRDAACFELKRLAFLKARHAEVTRELGKDVRIVSSAYGSEIDAIAKATGAEVVRDYSAGKLVAKPAPGAKPVLRDDGSLMYEKPAAGSTSGAGSPKRQTAGKAKSLKEKVAELEARRLKRAVLSVVESLTELHESDEKAVVWYPKDAAHALELIAAFGMPAPSEHDADKGESQTAYRVRLATSSDAQRRRIACEWAGGLLTRRFDHAEYASSGSIGGYAEEAQAVCHLARWDAGPGGWSWEERVRAARAEIPRPKSWPPENASDAALSAVKADAKAKGKAGRKGKRKP